jgi:hypothetical protein
LVFSEKNSIEGGKALAFRRGSKGCDSGRAIKGTLGKRGYGGGEGVGSSDAARKSDKGCLVFIE